jgi:MYXO-CTERM domain-containing protein
MRIKVLSLMGATVWLAAISTPTARGTIDITDVGLEITGGLAYPDAVAMLDSAFAPGGSGDITSSTALADTTTFSIGILVDDIDGDVFFHYAVRGDATLDNLVDNQDFGKVFANFGQPNRRWQEGDYDYDGDVDNTDFGKVIANWGSSAAVSGSSEITTISVVPSPAAVWAGLALLAGLAAMRRRRAV